MRTVGILPGGGGGEAAGGGERGGGEENYEEEEEEEERGRSGVFGSHMKVLFFFSRFFYGGERERGNGGEMKWENGKSVILLREIRQLVANVDPKSLFIYMCLGCQNDEVALLLLFNLRLF